MIAVIFESRPKHRHSDIYLDMGTSMMSLVEDFDGFISIERFESIVERGKFVALSFWRDEDAVTAWRNVIEHRKIQKGSRQTIFDDYRLRVASVIRDYSMRDRTQAPDDSFDVHG